MRYRPDIDGLRAVAVVPVLLFHAGVPGFPGGYVGVDVFFVISGFLIAGLIATELEQSRFSILRFYERRARRILPALFAVILFATVCAWRTFMPPEFAGFGKSAVATALFSSNILFWSESGYFDATADLKPLLHTWSLAVEEQFYVVFPLLLVLCHRLGPRWRTAILLPLLAASFALGVWGVSRWPEATFYLAPSRAWELLLGAVLALAIVPALARPWTKEAAGWLGLALLGLAIATFDETTPFPGINAVIPCAGAALLIWSGIGASPTTVRLLAHPGLVGIGLVSYSLYLWHWPLLVFARYVLMRPLTAAETMLVLALAAVLAYLSWRFIETPVRRGPTWTGRRVLAGALAASAATIAVGAAIARGGGLPGRLAPEVQAMLLANTKHDRRECHGINAERVKSGQVCIRGDEAREPSFVLAGDSHADALSPAVFAAAKNIGVAGYQFTLRGFRPLPGVRPAKDSRNSEYATDLVAFVRDHPGIKLIVLTGYWELQATGRHFANDKLQVFPDDGYDGSGVAYNKISFANGLRRLIEALPDRTFAILEDVPTGLRLDRTFAARVAHLTGRVDNDRFGIPRQDYEAERATYRGILEDGTKHGRAYVVPLVDVLCSRDFCSGARDGKVLYRDGGHLSPAGAAVFVDHLTEVLRKGLGTSTAERAQSSR